MLDDPSGYRLVFRAAGAGDPYATVVADAGTEHVTIYVAPTTPETPGGPPVASDPVGYPLDQVLLMNHLAFNGGVIVHSCGVELDGAGLVFAGASRAGKTTLSNLFVEAGLGAGLLSDDRIILRAGRDGRFDAWGTPWPGEAGVARSASAPLQSLFFLVQSDRDRIVDIDAGAAARMLMPVVSCPWDDRERLPKVLDICDRLLRTTPSHLLEFRPGQGAVAMLLGHLG
jgi:hypothetical protein